MATTKIITKWGNSFSVDPNYHFTVKKERPPFSIKSFSINLERYVYTKTPPRIRYKVEIVAERLDNSNQNTEYIPIIQFPKSGNPGRPQWLDEAYTLKVSYKLLITEIPFGMPRTYIKNS